MGRKHNGQYAMQGRDDDYHVPKRCQVLNAVFGNGGDKGDGPGHDATVHQLEHLAAEHIVQVTLINDVGALPTIAFCCVDGFPSLLLAFQPCPARRRTVHLLAIRPRRVRWLGEFGLVAVVEEWERHLG